MSPGQHEVNHGGHVGVHAASARLQHRSRIRTKVCPHLGPRATYLSSQDKLPSAKIRGINEVAGVQADAEQFSHDTSTGIQPFVAIIRVAIHCKVIEPSDYVCTQWSSQEVGGMAHRFLGKAVGECIYLILGVMSKSLDKPICRPSSRALRFNSSQHLNP